MIEKLNKALNGRILNLTQHPANEAQKELGVIEPTDKQAVRDLITFKEIPTEEEMKERALRLVEIAKEEGADRVMVAGAAYFMGVLKEVCMEQGMPFTEAYTHAHREQVFETDEHRNPKLDEQGQKIPVKTPDGRDVYVNIVEHINFMNETLSKSDYRFVPSEKERSDNVLNLTSHVVAEAVRDKDGNPMDDRQVEGIVYVNDEDFNRYKAVMSELQNLKEAPSTEKLHEIATEFANIADKYDCKQVMLNNGPSWLNVALEQAMLEKGIEPVYSFTERTEIILKDGSVAKGLNAHLGFVRPCQSIVEQNQEQSQEEDHKGRIPGDDR